MFYLISVKFRQWIPIIFVLCLFSVSLIAIASELKRYNLENVWLYLQNIPHGHKLLALIMMILGYGLMTGYDFLGFCHVGQKLALRKIIFTSFISYAIGSSVGFSAFSSGAIRYRYYELWGISKIKIVELIVFSNITFWLGISTIGGFICLLKPLSLSQIIQLPFDSIRPLGYIFLFGVIIYFLLSIIIKHPFKLGNEEITFPSPSISLGIIGIALLDWGLATGILYLLLPVEIYISYSSLFGIYIIALTVGSISSVPGGLGVFETVMLHLLPDSITPPQMLGGLIAYRFIYYIVPLTVALILILVQTAKNKYS